MWDKIFEFLYTNWLNSALVIVGTSALVVYWVQERRKVSEAASLIIMQVEDLQKRMREIGSYISGGLLNETAFYESQMLYKTDYWNKYKHYFIRKLDDYSFNTFDEFYNCASEVFEQQELMKNLQKNDFFLRQNMLVQIESNSVLQALDICNKNSEIIKEFIEIFSLEMDNEQKQVIENMLKQLNYINQSTNYDCFWRVHNKNKQDIHMVLNQNAITCYIPSQIKISIENALNKFKSISIIGCAGYTKMKKIAKRKI
ncbi:MAG: hypothetical protein ACLUKQ_05900 [Peptococcaceae bacterium]